MRPAVLSMLLLAMLSLLPRGQDPAPRDGHGSLFSQSAAKLLEKEFADPGVSFLLMDAPTGKLAAARWPEMQEPIPLGSLVKPFAAVAYTDTHGLPYPVHVCHGEASGCWLPRGHGRIGITAAIGYSCNSYFRALTQDLRGEQVLPTARRFGIEAPSTTLSGPALLGIGNGWKISPVHIAGAYLELYRRRDQPGIAPLLEGMAQSARRGTGLRVGAALPHGAALVKTGTAPCTHTPRMPGDGFAVALLPADSPQIVLLVRVHGVPGSKAAATAGHMLQRITQ